MNASTTTVSRRQPSFQEASTDAGLQPLPSDLRGGSARSDNDRRPARRSQRHLDPVHAPTDPRRHSRTHGRSRAASQLQPVENPRRVATGTQNPRTRSARPQRILRAQRDLCVILNLWIRHRPHQSFCLLLRHRCCLIAPLLKGGKLVAQPNHLRYGTVENVGPWF